jgi:hypothetical protein
MQELDLRLTLPLGGHGRPHARLTSGEPITSSAEALQEVQELLARASRQLDGVSEGLPQSSHVPEVSTSYVALAQCAVNVLVMFSMLNLCSHGFIFTWQCSTWRRP